MEAMAQRIRDRIAALGIDQAEAARRSGMSPQRFGNYALAKRRPDPQTLAKIASALETTPDALLGVSEATYDALEPILERLLELEGLPPARGSVIARVAVSALQLSIGLGDDGDVRSRSRLAAHAAWRSENAPKRPQ